MLFEWRNMKYIIHTCNKRLWYVEDYLIPSMMAQGIPEHDIDVHMDENYSGCLFATLDSFARCGRDHIDAWHLQDDVIISRDFSERSQNYDFNGVICGFWHRHECENEPKWERDIGINIRYSFPCIYIPHEIAAEFVEWFYSEAKWRDRYQRWIEAKKYVDAFFRDFIKEKHPDDYIWNLKPSIAEHVDWLIGGSTINKWREGICRAEYWEDEDLVEELKEKLKTDAHLC